MIWGTAGRGALLGRTASHQGSSWDSDGVPRRPRRRMSVLTLQTYHIPICRHGIPRRGRARERSSRQISIGRRDPMAGGRPRPSQPKPSHIRRRRLEAEQPRTKANPEARMVAVPSRKRGDASRRGVDAHSSRYERSGSVAYPGRAPGSAGGEEAKGVWGAGSGAKGPSHPKQDAPFSNNNLA